MLTISNSSNDLDSSFQNTKKLKTNNQMNKQSIFDLSTSNSSSSSSDEDSTSIAVKKCRQM